MRRGGGQNAQPSVVAGPTFNFTFNADVHDADSLVRRIKEVINTDLNQKLAVPQ